MPSRGRGGVARGSSTKRLGRSRKAWPRASRSIFTFGILAEHLDDVITLTEEELEEGVRLALRGTHNLAEGAGAAALAAAVKLKDSLGGKKVVAVMSGGNIDHRTLARIIGVRDSRSEAGRPETELNEQVRHDAGARVAAQTGSIQNR